MDTIHFAGFAVCAAVMSLVLRRIRPEAAVALVIAAGTLAGIMVLPQLGQIVCHAASLARAGGVQESYMAQLLKVGGVSLLMDFAAQTCRDAGEDGLAQKTEFVGRVILLALVMPAMHTLLEQIIALSP